MTLRRVPLMASANENAFTRSNQEQFLDKNIFCPQSSYFTKATARILYPRILYIINKINYIFFITACLIPRRQIIPV